MKSTATSTHEQDKAEPARSHAGNTLRSNSSTGYLGQLAAAINASPGVLAQCKRVQEIQNSASVEAQQRLALEINHQVSPQQVAVAQPQLQDDEFSAQREMEATLAPPAQPEPEQGVSVNDQPAAGENAGHTISRRIQLEKTRTASSATSTIIPIQARFDIELLFQEPGKREALFAKGISIDDLEEIQELLEDTETVNGYLQELEAAMERWFKDPASNYKYTKALDMALFEQEKKWMVPEVEAQQSKTSKSSRNKVEAHEGQEEQPKFLGRIKGAKPLKDVGAAVSHGEYAHRIQWYVISRSALSIGSISPALLKDIYSILGELGFLKEINKYVATAIKNTWSLWGAVVDVPASAAKAKPENEGQDPLGNVGFSAPVDLTSHISKGQGGLLYSQLRLAILNRRIKRYFQKDPTKAEEKGRADSELAGMFRALAGNPAKLPDEQHERVIKMLQRVPHYDKSSLKPGEDSHGTGQFTYDERNYIAFALSGIPLSS